MRKKILKEELTKSDILIIKKLIRKELASINKKYEKRITDINSYTSNELYQYLAKRYTP